MKTEANLADLVSYDDMQWLLKATADDPESKWSRLLGVDVDGRHWVAATDMYRIHAVEIAEPWPQTTVVPDKVPERFARLLAAAKDDTLPVVKPPRDFSGFHESLFVPADEEFSQGFYDVGGRRLDGVFMRRNVRVRSGDGGWVLEAPYESRIGLVATEQPLPPGVCFDLFYWVDLEAAALKLTSEFSDGNRYGALIGVTTPKRFGVIMQVGSIGAANGF